MTAIFRQTDIVARMGGEEFAVLLPSTGTAGALTVATRVLRAVEAQPVAVDGSDIRYTLSAGAATMAADISGLDALIKRADFALYEAKRKGRNRFECWSSSRTDNAGE